MTKTNIMAIDPRVLLTFSILYTIYIFIEKNSTNLAILTIFFVIIIVIRHPNAIKNVGLLFIFSAVMIGLILYAVFHFDIKLLLEIYFRITSITSLYTIFYSEIDPENLTKALVYFKLPYQTAWTISTSYRYIFFFINESEQVKNILLLRGVPLDGNIIDKLRSLPIIISQLIFRTNYLSIKFTETLFAKSWSPYGKKTWYRKLDIFDALKINSLIIALSLLIIMVMISNLLF